VSTTGAESAGLSTADGVDPAADDRVQAALDEHVIGQLQFREAPVTTGDYAMEMPVGPHVANNRGGLQGGLLATLVDVVAGIASLTGLPPGMSAATADLNLHFLSGVTVGPARAEAWVKRRGKRVIVTQVEVWDIGRDVLSAIATATFHVMELRADQPDRRDPTTF
jgi:uncharacterized protein (TIGR00369 family)